MKYESEKPVSGVYGLRIRGVSAPEAMAQVSADAPELRVSVEVGSVVDRQPHLDDERAEIELIDGGWLSLSRSGLAHFIVPRPIAAIELIHPWLAPAAATFNGWHSRQVFHGGVFSLRGKAIALIGDKEDGKSTLLASLARCGDVDVLADDLIVVDGTDVLAGPRCIDLRPESADTVSTYGHTLVRDDSRLRVALGRCDPAVKLHGIVALGWSDGPEVRLRELRSLEAFGALLPHAHMVDGGARLLDLLEVSTWSLTRPRSWSIMDDVVARLRALVG